MNTRRYNKQLIEFEDEKNEQICPKCRKEYLEYSATSRRDNTTKICSKCGIEEALFDFAIAEAQRKGFFYSKSRIEAEKEWLDAMC